MESESCTDPQASDQGSECQVPRRLALVSGGCLEFLALQPLPSGFPLTSHPPQRGGGQLRAASHTPISQCPPTHVIVFVFLQISNTRSVRGSSQTYQLRLKIADMSQVRWHTSQSPAA